MEKFCRICTSTLSFTDGFVSVNSSDAETNKLYNDNEVIEKKVLKYSDLICMITNKLDLTIFNGLSERICGNCALNLRQFYCFKIQIEKSNDFFLEMLKKLKEAPDEDSKCINVTHEEVIYNYETNNDNLVNDKEKLCNNLDIPDNEIVYEITETQTTSKDENLITNNNVHCTSALRKFETNTKQLSLEEQAKWQKKLELWIKKQPKAQGKNAVQWICENCGKIYSSKYALKQHEYVHTGVMNFECSECGRKFGQKKLLSAHMQIKHIKTKFFTCTKCGRVFNRSSTLAKHRWVHEDVRPFKCDYCEKTFKWKTCYKFHLNTHTKEITYNCYLCDKVYESRSSRRKHCLKFHGGLGRAPLEENTII